MIEAVSSGGVVIFRGKILVLYKHLHNKYEGWVLPKGTIEEGETQAQTALREVYEESGVQASIMKYIGKPVHLPCAGGYGVQGGTLVFDDRGQLLQQATAGRIFYGFRLL